MSVLWVHDGYQQNFERKINSYTDKLETVRGQYEGAMKVTSSYSGSDIYNCNVYLKKRKTTINNAISAAEEIKKNANSYVSGVVSTDLTISKSIHKQSYSFYQQKGIGPQKDTDWARAWHTITTSAEDMWTDTKEFFGNATQTILEFYEEHKYLVNLAFDGLAILSAILLFPLAGPGLFGVICLVGAVWALGKACYETVTDVQALVAHIEGDEERAEELSQSTLGEAVVDFGAYLDEKWDTHFMETAMKHVVGGLEVCEFVITMRKVGENIKKIFNLQDLNSLKLNKCCLRTWRENIADLKKVYWGGINGKPRLSSALNWTKFALYSAGFSIDTGAKNWLEVTSLKKLEKNVENWNKLSDGTSVLELSPITKPAYELAKEFYAIIGG